MISNIWLRRKAILQEALIPAIIVLVAVGAFGLGRLSALEAQQDTLVIHQPDK